MKRMHIHVAVEKRSVYPRGIAWETFLTVGESPVYGCDEAVLCADPRLQAREGKQPQGCCAPAIG